MNECDIVHAATHVWEKSGDFLSAFTVFIEFPFSIEYHTFNFVFRSENTANRLQLFLVQELKFSTSLIVIFWVLKILDFSRLTIVTSSALRFILIILILRIYDQIKSKYHVKDILLINIDPELQSDYEIDLIGINVTKTLVKLDLETINNEIKNNPYDEVWITGSKYEESNNINKVINLIVEYGLSVKVDNLLEIKTSITPKFEIIKGQNFISYTTSYLESNQYFFKRIFDIIFTITIGFILLPISLIISLLIIKL